MTDPRIIPLDRPLPPMDADDPADRQPQQPPKRKTDRRKRAVRRRFRLLNMFVDAAMAGLRPSDVAVWLVLYRHAKADGTVTAAVSDLGRRAGYCESATRRALKRLAAAGLIERLKRGTLAGGPSVYRMRPPAADSRAGQPLRGYRL